MKLPRSLAPLAERNFRLLWMGQAVSAAGDSMTSIALAFATLSITRSAGVLGAVLGISVVGRMIALPIGGVWSDRLPRQLVMLTSDAVRALVHAIIGGLLISGHAQLWELAAGAFVFSFAGGFFQPASGALTPQTVSAPLLQRANALMGLSRSGTDVAGPAISGILVALIGPGWVFVIDAATFVVSAVSLALLRVERIGGRSKPNFWSELVEGLRAVTGRRWYLLNLGAHALWNFAIAAFFVLGPVVAKQRLGGASAWGLIGAAMGVGAIAGGLIALRATPRRPLVVANLVLIPAALMLVAIAVPLPTVAIMAVCVVGWAGLTFLNEVWFATVPQLIPQEVLARASSFDWLLSIIAMPVGFAVSGPVADQVGIPTTLLGAAVLMAVPCFLITLVPGVRRVKRTDEGTIVMEAA
ncbi:MAG TPA: MFS transporter [Candidatus Dormibacteraeota bacterium]|nr:MFS transporter [Candidatus Dormibacteraeota bacterium]